MKKDERGYALGWSLIIVMVMMILVTSSLVSALSFYRKSVRQHDQMQAYLTARSVIQTVSADFVGTEKGEIQTAVTDILMNEDERTAELVTIPDINLQLDPSMGTGKITGYYIPISHQLVLTAVAEFNGQKGKVSVFMEKQAAVENGSWKILQYEEGEADE